MKKGVLFFLVLTILNSCSNQNDEPVDLLGKWKLIEQYSDPGDGSGTFRSVTSNRMIEFLDNGTVITNGTLCDINIETGDQSTGTYLSAEDTMTTEGVILPDACEYSEARIFYKLENNRLILSYLCIEGCGQKFIKL